MCVGFNNTTTCACGAHKEDNRQWCDACWDLLPEGKKIAFNSRLRAVAVCMEECDRTITAAFEPEARKITFGGKGGH